MLLELPKYALIFRSAYVAPGSVGDVEGVFGWLSFKIIVPGKYNFCMCNLEGQEREANVEDDFKRCIEKCKDVKEGNSKGKVQNYIVKWEKEDMEQFVYNPMKIKFYFGKAENNVGFDKASKSHLLVCLNVDYDGLKINYQKHQVFGLLLLSNWLFNYRSALN